MEQGGKQLSGEPGAWVYRKWSDLSGPAMELSQQAAWLLIGWAIALTWLYRGLVAKDTSFTESTLILAVVFWLVAVHLLAPIFRIMAKPSAAVIERMCQPLIWFSRKGLHLAQGNEVAAAKLVGDEATDMQPWKWSEAASEVRVLPWSGIKSVHAHRVRQPGDRGLLELRSAHGDQAVFVAVDEMDVNLAALAGQARRWVDAAAHGGGWRWLGRYPRVPHGLCVAALTVVIGFIARALESAYGDWFEFLLGVLLLSASLLGATAARIGFAASHPERRLLWLRLMGKGFWIATFAVFLVYVWFA